MKSEELRRIYRFASDIVRFVIGLGKNGDRRHIGGHNGTVSDIGAGWANYEEARER